MNKLEDIIITKDYGEIQIWSQEEMEYFFQDKTPTEVNTDE